jgi:NADPH-dependent 2,4-dienoyl-CoA reductase/sulfur reductase-like enzyme
MTMASTAADAADVADVADVAIVGGGPAGLAAALELRRCGVPRVVVLEREVEAGGIPRHTQHTGFGLRDLRRVLSGPAYAARYVDMARTAGVELRTSTSVTGWSGPREIELTSPGGRKTLRAAAIILATGCRERPRAARLIPGARPLGVLTTGALQQLVYLERQRVGTRAVIVGAEHVSFSAVLTLAHAGARTVAMVTDLPRHQTYRPLWATIAVRHRVPVLTGVGVGRIAGRRRVEAVELTDGRRIECDTVVFTGDWVPENELARCAGLTTVPGSLAPAVDGALRTEHPGVFAAGNLLHGAETADVCALDGRHVADAVTAWLADGSWPTSGVPVVAESPVRWVHPSVVRPAASPGRARYLLRVDRFVAGRRLAVVQGERLLWTGRSRGSLVPNRAISVPSGWEDRVDPAGGRVLVTVADVR